MIEDLYRNADSWTILAIVIYVASFILAAWIVLVIISTARPRRYRPGAIATMADFAVMTLATTSLQRSMIKAAEWLFT